MKSTKLRLLAAISLALLPLLAAGIARASKHPRYGGTLRVALRATSISLDPREWKIGSTASSENQKLAALVYDRLLTLDDYGRFQPALATEWSHDPGWRSWQFKLRPGVKFSDGSALSAAEVAAALQPLLPSGMQINAGDGLVIIRASGATPDLLEQLASGRYFIYRLKADGTLLGTGAFYVAENQPAMPSQANPSAMKPARIKFRANEEAWSGRPFLDAVDVTLGEPPLRQLFDLQLGKADVVEIAPDLVRKARQENLRVWSSAPNTLLALRFADAQPASADERLREAVALSLDRETMANVLLQRQADPTSALLPQWLSGYAFLFDSPMNLALAKEVRASLPANEAASTDPLRLRVDASGDLMKLLGERVAVNARQANLTVQVLPYASGNSAASASTAAAPAGLHLFAWHYGTISPSAELAAMAKQFALQDFEEGAQGVSDPERLFAKERRLLDERRILPLVLLPEFAGIGTSVRNWAPARWGEWRLAEVWLEQGDHAAKTIEFTTPGNSSSARVYREQP